MKTIHIFTHGTTLRQNDHHLVLSKDKQKLFELPVKDVGRIHIYGRTELTEQSLHGLFDCNVPLFYVRVSGMLKGKLVPPIDNHVLLRRRQYQLCGNDNFALPLARALIHTKMRNMAAVIAHLMRDVPCTAACRPIEDAYNSLAACRTREEIMGAGDAAARHYFRIYGQALPAPFQLALRSRHPAQDAGNALLNLGYMTLVNEIVGHLEAHDLDPYCGVLHAIDETRPNLALDMMEEFRQTMVDLFVMRAVRSQKILPTDFQTTAENGVQMSEQGLVTAAKNRDLSRNRLTFLPNCGRIFA